MRVRFLALGLVGALTAVASAQRAPGSGYLTPPKVIADIVEAPPLPGVSVSPTGDTVALVAGRGMPSLAELSQPVLRLAGIRINPANNGPHRAPSATGITLRTIAGGAERRIRLPPGARVGHVTFSPDGKRLYFTNTRDSRVDLYIVDIATAQARIVDAAVNGHADAVRVARRQFRAPLPVRAVAERRGSAGTARAERTEHPGKPR